MKKLIKVLIYMDTEDMSALRADVKSELLRINELYKKYGVGSIRVTTTGFDFNRDSAKGGWGWETPVKSEVSDKRLNTLYTQLYGTNQTRH